MKIHVAVEDDPVLCNMFPAITAFESRKPRIQDRESEKTTYC